MASTLVSTPPQSSVTALSLEVAIARSRQELTEAFQLVFKSYLQAGLVGQRPSGLRLTPHHLLPTSEVLLAKSDGGVVSTLSMFGDGYLGLPMDSMYPKELKMLRNQGIRLAEIGCLADRRTCQNRFIKTFAELGRLLAQVASNRGIDAIVAVTHPRHARLYERVMGFRQMGQLSDCPYANGNPAVALFLKFEEHRGTPLYARYFDNPFTPVELELYRWDLATRQHFREILRRDNQPPGLPGIQGYYNWAAATGLMPA
jgi:hypothetical protein